MFSKFGKTNKLDEPSTVEEAMSGGPGFVADYAVGSLRERRLLVSLRVVSLCLFLTTSVALVLSFILLSLFPLKEVRPFLVQVAEQGSIAASITPIRDSYTANELLTEKLIREYVINRNEILRSDTVMQERWGANGFLGLMTSPDEYNRFVQRVTPQLESIRQLDGQTRVQIISVNPVRYGQVYIVDYRALSYNAQDRLVDDRVYTATLEIGFYSLAGRTKEQLLINPTGFTVLNHTIAEKTK